MDTDDGNDTPKYCQKAADKILQEFQKMAEEQQKTAVQEQEKVECDSGQRSNLLGTSQNLANTEVQKQPLKQQQQNNQTNSSGLLDQDDQIVVDKKALNTDILSKKLIKIKHDDSKIGQEKVQEEQELDQGILNASGHPHKYHQSQVDQSKDEGKGQKRRGFSTRNAIRVAFNDQIHEIPVTPSPPPEDPVKYPIKSSFASQIPLEREIEFGHLIHDKNNNSSFDGSQDFIAIVDVASKKGVMNIHEEGDQQIDTLSMVQIQLAKLGKIQEDIMEEIKSEIDTLRAENLGLLQENEKLKDENNQLLEKTVDLQMRNTKDLEGLKKYVQVKKLESQKMLIKSNQKKSKGRHLKKSKNPNKEQMNSSNESDADEKKSSSESRRQHKEEFYYDVDVDQEFGLQSTKSHRRSSVKNLKESSKSTEFCAKMKRETVKYEKNDTNCFSFLLGGSRKKKRAENDDE